MVNLSQILHAGKNTEIQAEKGTEKGKCKNAIMQKYKNRGMENGKACDIFSIMYLWLNIQMLDKKMNNS